MLFATILVEIIHILQIFMSYFRPFPVFDFLQYQVPLGVVDLDYIAYQTTVSVEIIDLQDAKIESRQICKVGEGCNWEMDCSILLIEIVALVQADV